MRRRLIGQGSLPPSSWSFWRNIQILIFFFYVFQSLEDRSIDRPPCSYDIVLVRACRTSSTGVESAGRSTLAYIAVSTTAVGSGSLGATIGGGHAQRHRERGGCGLPIFDFFCSADRGSVISTFFLLLVTHFCDLHQQGNMSILYLV